MANNVQDIVAPLFNRKYGVTCDHPKLSHSLCLIISENFNLIVRIIFDRHLQWGPQLRK